MLLKNVNIKTAIKTKRKILPFTKIYILKNTEGKNKSNWPHRELHIIKWKRQSGENWVEYTIILEGGRSKEWIWIIYVSL